MNWLLAYKHHRCDDPWREAPPWAIEIREMLHLILKREDLIMTVLDDAFARLEAAAQANSDADDAAEKLLLSLAQMIADLKAAGTDPATVAKITALADALSARAAQLGAAVAAGTTSP